MLGGCGDGGLIVETSSAIYRCRICGNEHYIGNPDFDRRLYDILEMTTCQKCGNLGHGLWILKEVK